MSLETIEQLNFRMNLEQLLWDYREKLLFVKGVWQTYTGDLLYIGNVNLCEIIKEEE